MQLLASERIKVNYNICAHSKSEFCDYKYLYIWKANGATHKGKIFHSKQDKLINSVILYYFLTLKMWIDKQLPEFWKIIKSKQLETKKISIPHVLILTFITGFYENYTYNLLIKWSFMWLFIWMLIILKNISKEIVIFLFYFKVYKQSYKKYLPKLFTLQC